MRMAIMSASVPELLKRTFSAQGTSSVTSSPHLISMSVEALQWVPMAIWSWTALTTAGWLWPRISAPCPVL